MFPGDITALFHPEDQAIGKVVLSTSLVVGSMHHNNCWKYFGKVKLLFPMMVRGRKNMEKDRGIDAENAKSFLWVGI